MFLLFYHKVQIKTSTSYSLTWLAQTERIWGGSDTRPKKSTWSYIFLRARRSSRLDGICFFGLYVLCFVNCFITEWCIRSQAGLEINAGTAQHGSFLGFSGLFFFFFSSFISWVSMQAWVDTTRSTRRVFTDGEEDGLERRTIYKFCTTSIK